MENALVILCGGNSTRMGTDKALLPFGDTCLIEYLVRKFQPYFSRIYLSVKIKGDYSHLKLPVTEIPDIYPNQGPMSGIFSGLSMIDEECAFFMSVDTPFLEPKQDLPCSQSSVTPISAHLRERLLISKLQLQPTPKIALQPSENVSCSTSSRSIRCGKSAAPDT